MIILDILAYAENDGFLGGHDGLLGESILVTVIWAQLLSLF